MKKYVTEEEPYKRKQNTCGNGTGMTSLGSSTKLFKIIFFRYFHSKGIPQAPALQSCTGTDNTVNCGVKLLVVWPSTS